MKNYFYITGEQLERLGKVHLLLAREIRQNPVPARVMGYEFVCSNCKSEVSTTDERSFAEKLCVDCEIERNRKL
jgi:hypothetical protein